jgi:CRISPR-associated protein Csx17
MSPHELVIEGCAPEPLAHYLKAVAIHRIVAEQVDPGATSFWRGDQFVLRSKLDLDGLRTFFLKRWVPTPVVSPWNGGSGFHPGDNTAGIATIEASSDVRFAPWQTTIAVSRATLANMGLAGKPDKGDKALLIEHLRAELPDRALAWLDAALHVTHDGLKFPPLLGTGGNDGRLDFSNNFMQQVCALLGPDAKQQDVAAALDGALTGAATRRLGTPAVGQFFPAASGGVNAGPGFEGGGRVNPWDYVWMVEGALLFAAASTRKLDAAEPSVMVFPFAVRASGAGYASGADADEGESRDEMWMPLWGRPSTLRDLRALIGEGRCTVRGTGGKTRPAHSAVDFARALGQLGVDHGVVAFTRYGFHVRNGLAYQAVPLGRWRRRANEAVDLLAPLDDWMRTFRRVTDDAQAPASLKRLRRRCEEAVLALCQTGDVEGLLVTLGAIDGALATRRAWCIEKRLGPVPWLDADWALQLSPSVERRLAAALASREVEVGGQVVRLRDRVSPIQGKYANWAKPEEDRTCWTGGNLEANLGRLLLREQAEGAVPRPARCGVFGADIAKFLDGAVDDRRIDALARGLALVRALPPLSFARGQAPNALYSVLALAVRAGGIDPDDRSVKRVPGLVRRALAGDASGASAAALVRLRGDGRPAAISSAFAVAPSLARRCGAALAFPIDRGALAVLADHILVTQEPQS